MARIVLGPLMASFLEEKGLEALQQCEATLMANKNWLTIIHDSNMNLEVRYTTLNRVALLKMSIFAMGVHISEVVIPARPCRTRIDIKPEEMPATISQGLIGEPFSRLVQGPDWLTTALSQETIERYYDNTGIFHSKTMRARKAILLKRGTTATANPNENQYVKIIRI